MRSRIAVIALALSGLSLCIPLAFAQEAQKAFTLSMRSSAGILYGQAEEYVYYQDFATDYKVSELDWPFEPLAYIGQGLDFGSKSGIFASLDVKEALPGVVGSMTDSDYLNFDGQRTHFSESDSYAERMIAAELRAGYELPGSGPFRFAAYLGFSYLDFKWSARDGYYQYPTSGSTGSYPAWSASETKTPIYGTSILYEAAYLSAYLGARASYALEKGLSLGAYCSFSPIAFAYTADNHELRQLNFYSTLKSGYLAEPGLSIEYALKPGARLSLSASYKAIWNLKGDLSAVNQGTSSTSSYYNYYAGPDSSSTSKGDSGAAISMLDVGLSFTMAY